MPEILTFSSGFDQSSNGGFTLFQDGGDINTPHENLARQEDSNFLLPTYFSCKPHLLRGPYMRKKLLCNNAVKV